MVGRHCEDVWEDDGCEAGPLAREAAARGAGLQAAGYREGLEAGKEAALQAGFDAGWADGAAAGFAWGQARGAAGALRAFAAAHPPGDGAAAEAARVALGGGALGLSRAALAAAWSQLPASLCALADGQGAAPPAEPSCCGGGCGGRAGEVQSCAGAGADSELVLRRMRESAAHLRTLGIEVVSWEAACQPVERCRR